MKCIVCGDDLPKYKLERYTDEYCGYGCDMFYRGAAVAFGLIGMAEAIRNRVHGEACETCGGREHGRTSYEAGWRDACWQYGSGE